MILLVNASDPARMVYGVIDTSSPVNGMTAAGGLLYVGGVGSVSIYDIGQVVGDPLTISARVPNDANTPYVLSSFNLPPSEITHGTDYDTLTWVSALGFGVTSLTLSWTTDLDNLLEGEVRYVTLGSQVDFTVGGTPGTIDLPPTDVAVYTYSDISITPRSQTVQPGATATYSVGVSDYSRYNPVTYHLSVVGIPASWVSLPSTVQLAAFGNATVPLVITPTAYAPAGTYGFTVDLTDGTISESAQATLIVAGQPVLPDADSHGIVATLIPTSATAGQGTSAQYVVQLTNTGSADDTFSLAASGLPPGVTAAFGQATIDVPPGASNFRDITLTLTVPAGTAIGTFTFQVSAASTTLPAVSATTSGSLTIVPEGVSVGLSPGSAAPGGTFALTVTNTGQVSDTFILALGGPAALVASLGLGQVTLAPGASQVVPITTADVNFAVPGGLDFTASATSRANPAVQAAANGSLAIPTFEGLTAQFSPRVQTIAGPGSASFLLDVNNTGNAEDSYDAIIIGTSGPVTASLTGLDGSPTAEISLFRLPGLSTGAIVLQAAMAALGEGTVTVEIESLTDGSIVATATATINALAAAAITLTPSNASPTYGQSLTFATTVAAVAADAAGDPVPTGTAQFAVDGVDLGSAITLANGSATSIDVADLSAGQHTITVAYGGDSTYGPESQTYTLTVAPAPLTITAADAARVTGQANPPFSATYSGFVLGQGLGDLAGTLTFTTAATTASPPGDYSIVPGGLSSGNYAITFVAGNLAVNKAAASISTSSSPTGSQYGQPLTFTATVTPATPGGPTPTGTVQFLVDGVDFGAAVVMVNGVATSPSVATFGAGSHAISEFYSGDASFNPATASAVAITVTPAPLLITAGNATRPAGQPNPAFAATGTGFVLGQGLADLAGTLVFTTAATTGSPPGSYAITPTGLTSANYAITYAAGTIAVTQAAATVTTAASLVNPVYGQAVNFSALVRGPSGGLTPTGAVQFLIDGSPFGTPVSLVNGVATGPSVATLAIGVHTVTASYAGDADFAPVASTAATSTTVTVAAPSPVLDPIADRTIAEGQAVTLTAHATDPAWALTYSLDPGAPAGAQIDATTGAFTWTPLVPGTYAITVRASDGATPPLSAAQAFTITVTDVPPVVTLGPAVSVATGVGLTQAGSFVAPGVGAFTATVDYGDGSGTVPLALRADRTFTLAHAYSDPGTYSVLVTVTDPSGAVGTGSLAVGVVAGASNLNPPLGTLAGHVYDDLNYSRAYNPATDPGIAWVQITLSGTDAQGNAISLQTTTDAAGAYSFGSLPMGTYTVREAEPAGYLAGSVAAGSLGGVASGRAIGSIAVAAGGQGAGYDFGEVAPASLAGRVYLDANRNGRLDDEFGVAHVVVTLRGFDNQGHLLAESTTTAADGSYAFSGLLPGTYQVAAGPLAQFKGAGQGDPGDASGVARGSTIAQVSLAGGTTATGYDFAESIRPGCTLAAPRVRPLLLYGPHPGGVPASLRRGVSFPAGGPVSYYVPTLYSEVHPVASASPGIKASERTAPGGHRPTADQLVIGRHPQLQNRVVSRAIHQAHAHRGASRPG